jgi:hypothetical protein
MITFLRRRWKLGFLLLLGIGFLPFLVLSFFTHPTWDDFCLAALARQESFLQFVLVGYNEVGGSYFSFILFKLNPLAFGSILGYKLVAFSVIVLTFIAIHLFVMAIFKNYLPQIDQWIFSSVVTLLFFNQMPVITQCIYWATGALSYQLPNLVSLLALSLALYIVRSDSGRIRKGFVTALVFFLTAISVGANIPNMLLFTLLLCLITFVSFANKLEHKWLWLCMLLIAVTGAIIVIAAPGNSARSELFPEKHQFFRALVLSSAQVARFAGKWLSNVVLILATLLYIPIAARLAGSSTFFKNHFYIHPLLGIAFLLIILYAGFFPAYWSMGSLYQHRTVNVSYFWFLICWFLNIQIAVSYLKKRWAVAIERFPNYFNYFAVPVMVIALLTTGNTGLAFYDLLSKNALYYDREMNARYKLIETQCSGKETPCVLDPLEHEPATVFLLDLTSDANVERNRCFARYFRLPEVRLKPRKESSLIESGPPPFLIKPLK